MNNNQSIMDIDNYIEILILKYLLTKGDINKATYSKVRKNIIATERRLCKYGREFGNVSST